eukprot:scaffold7744_cov90-Cylindrotheca_fusiformis.AAC.9
MAIAFGVVQILMRRYPKDATVVQLLCQRNDIEAKETDIPAVPILTGFVLVFLWASLSYTVHH